MYQILVLVQSGSVILLLIEAIYIFNRWKVHMHSLLFLNVVATLVNNLGYLMEMTAKTSQAALYGTRVCYLGKVFVSLTFFAMMMQFCRVWLPAWIYRLLTLIHAGVFFLVLSSSYQSLYYTGWTWDEGGLFPHNDYGHGIFYWLYMALVLGYVLVGLIVMVHALMKESRKDRRASLGICLAAIAADVAGIVAFQSKVTRGYDSTALAYMVSSMLMYIAIYRFGFMHSMADMEQAERVRRSQQDVITGLATLVDSRDNSTGAHILRTSDAVSVFVEYLQSVKAYPEYSAEFFDDVTRAAPMHDLGKIAIDDAVLKKPGRFTPEEFEAMKKHPEEGALVVSRILENSEDDRFREIATNVAHYHHEKWDGSGYPEGLSGEQIPFEARIMALADVFDALVSKRCYKEKYDYDTVFDIMKDSMGTHFDPKLGKYFLELRTELEHLYDKKKS